MIGTQGTDREKILSQLAEIDARLSRIETRLAELLPSTRAVPTEPQATEVRVVMEDAHIGTIRLPGCETTVVRHPARYGDRWSVLGYGVSGNSLDGIGKALARRLGVTGTVNVTVVAPE